MLTTMLMHHQARTPEQQRPETRRSRQQLLQPGAGAQADVRQLVLPPGGAGQGAGGQCGRGGGDGG